MSQVVLSLALPVSDDRADRLHRQPQDHGLPRQSRPLTQLLAIVGGGVVLSLNGVLLWLALTA